ncbi:T6SS phospholipase effector Tle1-like catalytic domain-containing protein [Enhygromyxa salina]|uniref:T6SS Phospholipase effector Tle1-like catalytic domain-containing protein n=1 Tax=Enhygromyxa salina TaxID=215803 RepID=A0A2S9YVW1_9BACT|nr:DUF2235 domain-containing protein [Enhygromyxa salina]PRQ09214.1 hypothetical protein ENSA7_12040 [Enhygromyxa salina]
MVEQGERVTQSGGASSSGSSSSSSRTLEIGFFFDGTLNNLENAGGSREGSYANAKSNVALLYQLYSNASDHDGDGSERRRRGVYLEGIGTNTNGSDDMVDAALGTGNTGVSARVHAACRRLEQEARGRGYAEILVDTFGFSRGAAAARYFVNCVNRRSFEPVRTGFLLDDEPTDLGRVQLPEATVRFVGLFDTVAAIGTPRDGADTSDADNADVNVHLDDSSAQAICHFVAANEYRKNFASNSIRSRSGAVPSGGVEIVYPGAHSDIGGGYRARGETVVPVQPAFGNFATRAEALACRDELMQRYSAFAQRMIHEHYAGTQPPEFSLSYDEMREDPNGLPSTRYSYDGRVAWVRSSIDPGLEKVYLELMHRQARSHGVPFRSVPNTSEYAIPAILQGIHSRLAASPQLGVADLAMLRMNFIHWSCHYGRADGNAREAMRRIPGFQVDIYPHEPAPNWQRIIHHNQPNRAC